MKHAIACLNTQIGILLHNASVFHGEGREEDRDRSITESNDLRMAVEVLKNRNTVSGLDPVIDEGSKRFTFVDGVPVPEGSGIEPGFPKFTGTHTPSAPDTLTLELGKRYVRRDGKITGRIIGGPDPVFPFHDATHDETYQPDGLSGFEGDEEWDEDIVAEYVEPQSDPDTDATQFRLLASFVRSKATSHTEIVSDTAAEIRALRTSLEAERYRTAEAVRKLEKFRYDYDAKAAEVVELRGRVKPEPQEQEYRMLEVGEVTQDGDEVMVGGDMWERLASEHLGQRINPLEMGYFPVGYYRRPISLDTKPENPDTPAA